MKKPDIRPTAETAVFWASCQEEKLCYQRCKQCETVQPVPRMYCGHCHSPDLDWHESAGQGTVLSHSTVHRAASPAFREDAPYMIALLDMDEGFRLMVNLQKDADGGLMPVSIGDRIRIGFADHHGQLVPVGTAEVA